MLKIINSYEQLMDLLSIIIYVQVIHLIKQNDKDIQKVELNIMTFPLGIV